MHYHSPQNVHLNTTSSTFTGNSANQGGAVWITGLSSSTPLEYLVSFRRAVFLGNTAQTQGSALLISGSNLVMIEDGNFSYNIAMDESEAGGTIVLGSGATELAMINSHVSFNIGGGISMIAGNNSLSSDHYVD